MQVKEQVLQEIFWHEDIQSAKREIVDVSSCYNMPCYSISGEQTKILHSTY